jgi:hypothetical protein
VTFDQAGANALKYAEKRRWLASGGRRRPDLEPRQSETVAGQGAAEATGSEHQCSAERPEDSCWRQAGPS